MDITILDKSVIENKNTNPADMEFNIKQEIGKLIKDLTEDLDVSLVKNIFITNNNLKCIGEVKCYIENNKPCLDVYLRKFVIECWITGYMPLESKRTIYHEFCHCDDAANNVRKAGTRYFFPGNGIMHSIKDLYESIGTFLWGEYIAYYRTYMKFGINSTFESKLSKSIVSAGISINSIKNSHDKNANSLYFSTIDSLRSLFYCITKKIALEESIKSQEIEQSNDKLLLLGEEFVNGIKSLSDEVQKVLLHMHSIAYEDEFFTLFYKLGQLFYKVYEDNGIKPIENNGEIKCIYI